MSRGSASALGADTAVMAVRVAGGTAILVVDDAERGLGTGGKSNDARNGVETGSEKSLVYMGVGGGMAVAAVSAGGGGGGERF